MLWKEENRLLRRFDRELLIIEGLDRKSVV